MILDSRRIERITRILEEMTRGVEDDANVIKDAAILNAALRLQPEGGAKLYPQDGIIKVLARLIDGRLASHGSNVDIPSTTLKFRRNPEVLIGHIQSMNPARLAQHGLSASAIRFFSDSFALGLVLLELMEEKEDGRKERPDRAGKPDAAEIKEAKLKRPANEPATVKRKRGRPPKGFVAAGKENISAIKARHHGDHFLPPAVIGGNIAACMGARTGAGMNTLNAMQLMVGPALRLPI